MKSNRMKTYAKREMCVFIFITFPNISHKSFEFSQLHLFIFFEQRDEIFTLSYSQPLTRLEKTLRRVEHDLLTQSTRTRSRKSRLAGKLAHVFFRRLLRCKFHGLLRAAGYQ